MELVVPDMGNCTNASFQIDVPCTATRFRQIKRVTGVDSEGDSFGLVDLFPEKAVRLSLSLRLVRGKKSVLRLSAGLRAVHRTSDRPPSEGKYIEGTAVWDALLSLMPEQLGFHTDVSFHYARGTYEVKALDSEGVNAMPPTGKPAVWKDGVSLRFSDFPNGLEQIRIYAIGPLQQEKCLQVDVYHLLPTNLTADVFERMISVSRVAAGLFVEMKGKDK